MRSHATFLSITTLLVALAASQQTAQTRSGTVPQLIPYSGTAKDVSGKPLRGAEQGVEWVRNPGWMQHIKHLRPERLRTTEPRR